MKKGWILVGLAMACGWGAQAADFTNLDFEDYTPDAEGFSVVVPGWSNNWVMCMDCYPLEGAALGLVTTDNEYNTPLEGGASLFLGTGNLLLYGVDEIWVSQAADVPAGAASIRFLTTLLGVGATLEGGSLTAGAPEELEPGLYRYAADVSALAGQPATLKIALGWSEWGRYLLDQIEFLDAEGTVIWPLPRPEPVVCLEDFHAATLNPSLWEVVATFGPTNEFSISSESLRTTVNPLSAPFETIYRYRSVFRGDWDVRMDFHLMFLATASTNPGVLGMALAADFGPDRTSTAGVGHLMTISNQTRFFGVDWGQGPTNEMATTNQAGVFRLARTGGEVAGYVWDAGSNAWQIVGTADGYTDDVARVGLKVWCTGTFGGKSAYTYSDNLTMANGRMSLDGMAIKTFGLDESGAPAVAWDSVGIPQSNRYVVSCATSLVGSAWTPMSGALADSGGATNWTGANPGAGSLYYRIESVPGP
jgi:hypothetical protein